MTVSIELGQARLVDGAVLAVGRLTAAGTLDLMGMVEVPRSESLQEFIWQSAMILVVLRNQLLVFRGLSMCDEEVKDIRDEWYFSLAEETQKFLVRTGTSLVITLLNHPVKQHLSLIHI